MPFGNALFLDINEFARNTPWLHSAAHLYATYGVALFGVLWLIVWWRARSAGPRLMAAVLLTPVATVLAFALQQLVVLAVHEPRPYAVHPGILVLVGRTTDSSFPSDHACVSAAMAIGLLLTHRMIGSLAVVAALVMAVTRVYVGAHWPGDVVAGLALGGVVAWVTLRALRAPATRVVEWLMSGPLRPLATSR